MASACSSWTANLITTEHLDITDDFRDAFVASLNVITIDRRRFSAQTAERRDGDLIIFRQGVYTACGPALSIPRVRRFGRSRRRASSTPTERTIYYENARLEFFGVPIAYPRFFPSRSDVQTQDRVLGALLCEERTPSGWASRRRSSGILRRTTM